MSLGTCILRGRRLKCLNFNIVLSMKIVFILANSADPTDMSHFIWVFIVDRIRLSVSKMKRVARNNKSF